MQVANIMPDIGRSHKGILVIGIDPASRAYCPGGTTISTNTFTHVIPFLCASSLTDALGMKAIMVGLCIEQNGVMLAGVVLTRTPAGLIMPDDFVLKACPFLACMKNLIQ